jgi:hypothetical protein
VRQAGVAFLKGAAQMAEEAHTAEAKAAQMTGMPPMLAYTLRAPIQTNAGTALIKIGQGSSVQTLGPNGAKDQTYWFVILDANKPATIVQQWVTPSNNAIPSGLDQYMSNPAYLFAVVTQVLSNGQVPQGPLYDYLSKHGAGRELQKLEQLSPYTLPPYGLFAHVSYVLTGQGGPGGIAYERGSFTDPAVLELSLMPQMNGQPPYSICDSYTFVH